MAPYELAIRARLLSKSYKAAIRGEHHRGIFRDFSLDLRPGRTLAILGPSGCGKSTLLRMFAGIDFPASGSVLVYGSPPTPLSKSGRISLLSSSNSLLPWRSALGNVQLPLDLLGTSQSVGIAMASQRLQAVRLPEDAWKRRPHELSEGQKQRVRLAQALSTNPQLLLFDEPFSNVDEGLRRLLIEMTSAYLSEDGSRSAVIVTHSSYEAAVLADEVTIINGSPAAETYHRDLSASPNRCDIETITDIVNDLTDRLIALANNEAR